MPADGPLDLERFGELCELYSADEFREVVGVFLAVTLETIAALEEACAREDAAAVRDAAHRLRGGSLALGAMRLAGAAGELERRAITAEEPLAPARRAVTEAWAATEAALRAAVPGLD